MATTAEEVEQILVADWHNDWCGCHEFDGVDLQTCRMSGTGAGKTFMAPSGRWRVERVLDAFDQVMAARADRKVT